MKFALVGVGGAGCRLVDQILQVEQGSDRSFSGGNVLAYDTDKSVFETLDAVPLDRHVLVGDTHEALGGTGTDGDIDQAAAVAQEDRDELHREFDKLDLHEMDAVFVVAGFGGGTGGGVGPVIVEALTSVSELPIYVLGVLPTKAENGSVTLNAARSLQSFVTHGDNTILFDNESWYDEESPLAEQYGTLNETIAQRLLAVFAAGERQSADIAENRLDTSDVMRIMETGGVSTLGYAETDVHNPTTLFQRLRALFRNGEEDTTDAIRIKALVKEAAESELTLPCDRSSTERALVVLSGPPHLCSRKGFEKARQWLEEETDTVVVLAGDEPRPTADDLRVAVLFSNVTTVPRIEALKEDAVLAETS